MEENIIRETVEIEDDLEAGNKCECLIDASSGALLEIKAPAFWVWTLRLPDSVRRISKEFKTCFVRPGSDRARPARIRELVIPAGMEEIEPDTLQWIDKITIEQDSPKYRMAGSALIEVAPDGSGKVVKYNGNIPTDGWITTLGKNSRGARLRPDIHGNYLEDMIIPDNIETLEDGAIESLSTDCFAISLPRGLKIIKGRQDFGLTRIRYRGTVKQWKAVKKNPDYSDGKIAVECTDGTIYECGDPDLPFQGLEKIGGCVVNIGDRCVAAFDNSFDGDIVIPEFVKFVNPYAVGIPCEKIVLGNGRNLVLHSSLEYVSERAVCATDADFRFIMDEPGDKYRVSYNMLIETKENKVGKVILGWFGEDAKVERITFKVATDSILNTDGTDIFIPEGIETIDTEAVRHGKFGTIRLPKSLTWLELNPFGRSEFEKYIYAGTVRRWRKIVKEKHWAGRRNEGKGKTVVCSDGEVPVEEYNPSGFYEEDGD